MYAHLPCCALHSAILPSTSGGSIQDKVSQSLPLPRFTSTVRALVRGGLCLRCQPTKLPSGHMSVPQASPQVSIMAVFFGCDRDAYESSAEKGFVDCDCFFERWRTYGVTVGHNGVIHFDAGLDSAGEAARLNSAWACNEDGMDGDCSRPYLPHCSLVPTSSNIFSNL